MIEVAEMTEKEMHGVKMSTRIETVIYARGEKVYTTDEIVELLDKIATAKNKK